VIHPPSQAVVAKMVIGIKRTGRWMNGELSGATQRAMSRGTEEINSAPRGTNLGAGLERGSGKTLLGGGAEERQVHWGGCRYGAAGDCETPGIGLTEDRSSSIGPQLIGADYQAEKIYGSALVGGIFSRLVRRGDGFPFVFQTAIFAGKPPVGNTR